MSDNADAPLVLITRPQDAAHRFADELRDAVGPVEVAVIPMLEITQVVDRIDLDGVSALIFTSAAGVDVFRNLDDEPQPCRPGGVVANRTARPARAIGLKRPRRGGMRMRWSTLMAEASARGASCCT